MPSPSIESVVDALTDPLRSASNRMRILRVLLTAERGVYPWLTISEIARYADLPPVAVGSRIRDLRLDGFTIARARRPGDPLSGRREWEYRIFYATQGK